MTFIGPLVKTSENKIEPITKYKVIEKGLSGVLTLFKIRSYFGSQHVRVCVALFHIDFAMRTTDVDKNWLLPRYGIILNRVYGTIEDVKYWVYIVHTT